MTILLPQIFFQTQRDEEGNLFGCFYGEELYSNPIFSQETALMVFKELKKTFTLSPEEITAVEICIEKSELPILSSEQELLKMRINCIEADLQNVFNIFSVSTDDREIEKNCVGLKSGGVSQLN